MPTLVLSLYSLRSPSRISKKCSLYLPTNLGPSTRGRSATLLALLARDNANKSVLDPSGPAPGDPGGVSGGEAGGVCRGVCGGECRGEGGCWATGPATGDLRGEELRGGGRRRVTCWPARCWYCYGRRGRWACDACCCWLRFQGGVPMRCCMLLPAAELTPSLVGTS